MAKKTNKGPPFERWFAKELSKWWTLDEPDGPRDDVFWRTQNSGGRATGRSKKGVATRGQHGDICATDPIGKPLLDVVTIECKRGRSTYTIQDLLDAPAKAAEQMYAKWIAKAAADAKAAGTPYWLLVVRRDKRLPLVLYPWMLVEDIHHICRDREIQRPYAVVNVWLADKVGIELGCETLADYLQSMRPEWFRALAKELAHGPAD